MTARRREMQMARIRSKVTVREKEERRSELERLEGKEGDAKTNNRLDRESFGRGTCSEVPWVCERRRISVSSMRRGREKNDT